MCLCVDNYVHVFVKHGACCVQDPSGIKSVNKLIKCTKAEILSVENTDGIEKIHECTVCNFCH